MNKDISALVVEDDTNIREIIVGLLEERKINVLSADDPGKACDLIKSHNPALLICDTELGNPSGNKYGVQVAEFYKKHNPQGIIIGMSSEESYKSFWEGKCNAFHKKDYLLRNINLILEQYFKD